MWIDQSLKIKNMSLKLITLAAFAATAQAACDADASKKMTDCVTKVSEKATTDMTDKTKICPYFQELYACYPACYCDDANFKSVIDQSIKSSEDSLKAMDVTCSLKCGAGSALAPGMALTLALMAAARLYE